MSVTNLHKILKESKQCDLEHIVAYSPERFSREFIEEHYGVSEALSPLGHGVELRISFDRNGGFFAMHGGAHVLMPKGKILLSKAYRRERGYHLQTLERGIVPGYGDSARIIIGKTPEYYIDVHASYDGRVKRERRITTGTYIYAEYPNMRPCVVAGINGSQEVNSDTPILIAVATGSSRFPHELRIIVPSSLYFKLQDPTKWSKV